MRKQYGKMGVTPRVKQNHDAALRDFLSFHTKPLHPYTLRAKGESSCDKLFS